jgi:uncharacterized protein (TIGR02147 family)
MTVYSFTDYREYLQKAFDDIRKRRRNLSMREILRRIGCTSPSYYKEVIVDRKKNMSAAVARKIAAFLNLDGAETEYFIALVGHNQAKNELERNHFYRKMVDNFRGRNSEHHVLSSGEYAYLSSWEIPAIRELLLFYDTFGNRTTEERETLAQKFIPEVTGEQVGAAIDLLEKLQFVRKNPAGNYRRTEQNIRQTGKNPLSYLLLRQSMKHAVQIINKASPDTRIFKNLTISLSEHAYGILENRIQEFCREIIDIVSNDVQPADRLYTLGVQLFPLTKVLRKDNS